MTDRTVTAVATALQDNATIAKRLRARAKVIEELDGLYTIAELLREAARRLDPEGDDG